jgi:hypothetical protein
MDSPLLAVAALLIALAPVLSAKSPQGWMLGPEGVSCDEACPGALGSDQSTCYVDSMKALTSPALFERVMDILDLNDFDCRDSYAGSYPE